MSLEVRDYLGFEGEEGMGNQELLQLVFGDMAGRELYQKICGEMAALNSMSIKELSETKGIGIKTACRFSAMRELQKRIQKRDFYRSAVKSGLDAARIFEPFFLSSEKEIFLVMALNVSQKPIQVLEISKGSLVSCPVHPREVFRPLIKLGAISFICAHNHPSSGIPEPSKNDIELTKRLVETGKTVGIPLIDHIIIGRNSYTSLLVRGLL